MQVQLVQTGRSAPVIKLGWLYILFFFSKTFLQMLILLIWPLNPKPAWSCWTFSAWLSLTSDPKHQPSNLPWVLEDIVSLLSLSHDQPYCSDLTLSVCVKELWVMGFIPSIMVSVEQFSSFRQTAPARKSPILLADCSKRRKKLQIRCYKLLLSKKHLSFIWPMKSSPWKHVQVIYQPKIRRHFFL